MEKILLSAGIFVIPTMILVVWFKVKQRQVNWFPLVLAAMAYAVYLSLLRATNIVPVPPMLEYLTLNWVGKTLSIVGTLAMLYLMPNVDFRSAGLTWKQNSGSLKPVIIVGAITMFSMIVTTGLISSTTNTSTEWLLFQATMPGLDEELFMRGLLLLLLHQAFGKNIRIFGANTGWAFWLVVIFFGLLHGITVQDGELSVSLFAVITTGFVGIVLTWMRERTGSLVAPILFHNSTNIALAFF